MRQPKLKTIASMGVLLALGYFSCIKPPNNPPPTTTPTPPSNGVTTADCSAAANGVAKVVCLSNAFLATLSASQRASAQSDLTQGDAVHWSNLPCGAACRNGLEFVSMSAAQVAAAKAILAAATGTGDEEGYHTITQIIQADSLLGIHDNSGLYSQNYYFIAFLGTPSLTGSWQLQFGGHDLAVNLTYTDGVVKGPTPLFQGAKPGDGTLAAKGGTVYNAPLADYQSALAAMLASLSIDQLANAKINASFNDVLLGPGADGQYPAVKAGVKVSSLSQSQEDAVISAIKLWTQNDDSATAAGILLRYTLELSETFISYSNTPLLTSSSDYVRIDGPSVWIEFVCQPGGPGMLPSQIHYNTVWRDHRRDYGANFGSLVSYFF